LSRLASADGSMVRGLLDRLGLSLDGAFSTTAPPPSQSAPPCFRDGTATKASSSRPRPSLGSKIERLLYASPASRTVGYVDELDHTISFLPFRHDSQHDRGAKRGIGFRTFPPPAPIRNQSSSGFEFFWAFSRIDAATPTAQCVVKGAPLLRRTAAGRASRHRRLGFGARCWNAPRRRRRRAPVDPEEPNFPCQQNGPARVTRARGRERAAHPRA
jgi:hypothetical protein